MRFSIAPDDTEVKSSVWGWIWVASCATPRFGVVTDAPDNDIQALVSAIVGGGTDQVADLLAKNPRLATATLSGNPRSMLHHATDWPGHRPNVATSIALLVDAGADPNVAFPLSDHPAVAEKPLHWAASSNDTAAVDALLDAGAEVDALGGIFGGCTPYEEAIIFENYDAARRLLARGATDYLPGAAALGAADLIEGFFDDHGNLRTDIGRIPPAWNSPSEDQIVVDRAFQFACRAGHLDIAKRMLDRGADRHAITPADTSALDEATNKGHAHVVEWLNSL